MHIMMVAETPSSQSGAVPRWELTRGALTGLLARLDPDPTAAGEKYEHLRRALLKFFSWHQMPEPESAVDETLDRIARRMEAGHPIIDVPAFAHGVAKRVGLARRRQAAAKPTVTDDRTMAQLPAAPQPDDLEVRASWLQQCLAELSPKDRDLIVAYYVGSGRERIDGRARLAAALGVSENALRLRAQRLRDRLRDQAAPYLEQGRTFDGAWPHRHRSRVPDSTTGRPEGSEREWDRRFRIGKFANICSAT
jgi:DNA-directed RNA polymerase specialized sigma24 family protein